MLAEPVVPSSLSIVNFMQAREFTHWVTLEEVVAYVMKISRVRAKVAAVDLACELDTSPEYLCRLESGKGAYPVSYMAAAARMFGSSLAEILLQIHDIETSFKKDGILVVYDDREAEGDHYDMSALP